MEQHQLDAALADFKAAVSLQPGHVHATQMLGTLRERMALPGPPAVSCRAFLAGHACFLPHTGGHRTQIFVAWNGSEQWTAAPAASRKLKRWHAGRLDRVGHLFSAVNSSAPSPFGCRRHLPPVPSPSDRARPQHGASSKQMALITSDCRSTMCSLGIKWP